MELEACWAAFAKVAIPEGAPQGQHIAMRMAFLAGCSTVLELEQHSRKLPLPHQRRILDKWDTDVAAATAGAAVPT